MTGQSPPAVEGQSAAIRGEPMSACPYSVATPEGRAWHRAWLTAESYRQHQSGEAERRTLEQRAEAHRLAAVWEPARYDVNPVDVLCAEVAEVGEGPARFDRGGVLPSGWTPLPWLDDPDDPAPAMRWTWTPPPAPVVTPGPVPVRVEHRITLHGGPMCQVGFDWSGGVVATFVNQEPVPVHATMRPDGFVHIRLGDPADPGSFDAGPAPAPAARRSVRPAVDRRRHGAAAVCPRHGPTRGGLCRRCAR